MATHAECPLGEHTLCEQTPKVSAATPTNILSQCCATCLLRWPVRLHPLRALCHFIGGSEQSRAERQRPTLQGMPLGCLHGQHRGTRAVAEQLLPSETLLCIHTGTDHAHTGTWPHPNGSPVELACPGVCLLIILLILSIIPHLKHHLPLHRGQHHIQLSALAAGIQHQLLGRGVGKEKGHTTMACQ